MIRFARFNLVGLAGCAVQLAILTVFVDVAGMDYRVASVLALAATLVHNFTGHVLWTWRDRRLASTRYVVTFARFALGNGMVSLLGTLVLVPACVEFLGARPVLANLLSIVACSAINYRLADVRCFVSDSSRTAARRQNHLREAA